MFLSFFTENWQEESRKISPGIRQNLFLLYASQNMTEHVSSVRSRKLFIYIYSVFVVATRFQFSNIQIYFEMRHVYKLDIGGYF